MMHAKRIKVESKECQSVSIRNITKSEFKEMLLDIFLQGKDESCQHKFRDTLTPMARNVLGYSTLHQALVASGTGAFLADRSAG